MNHHKKNGTSSSNGGGRSSSKTSNPTMMAVGTEKLAQQELKKNGQLYHYPSAGFVNKIEYTLLYNMIYYPNIYPIHVIHPMILEEDYTQYIYVNESGTRSSSASTATGTTDTAPPCSYAQLTALLALAAEKWPPSTAAVPNDISSSTSSIHNNNNNHDTRRRTKYYDNDDGDDDDEYEQSRRQRQQQKEYEDRNKNTQLNVVQTLCQLLIQCIVRHCETHQLHRETEINELFLPFQKVTADQTNKRALMSTLPAYMGLTVTILSGGNPIPFYIGYAMSINAISQQEANLENYNQIANTTTRMSNIETTNLLHDTDHDYNNNDS
jgi:hypothetical protein